MSCYRTKTIRDTAQCHHAEWSTVKYSNHVPS